MLKGKDFHSVTPSCVVSGFSRTGACALMVAAVLTVACDKVPLLAPTQSTITVSAPASVLPSGGSTEITAFVLEQAGTPVQNGTTVRFSATLGRVDPVEAQTRGGLAITTFFAANSSGIAEIRATSGGATGGAASGTGTTPGTSSTQTNVVQITIGAAAVETVAVRANPASVGPSGGTVELIATVVGVGGQALSGVVVTFNADQGSLSSSTATTNAGGEARTTLTTSQLTVVSATAGIKPSTPVTITVRSGPIVSITCAPSSGGTATSPGNCAALQASASNNTATLIFTITRPTGSSTLRTATIDFGDGTSQSLGNLAGGSLTTTHIYTGPSGSTPQTYTATVQVTDINGESAAASTTVIVTPRPIPTPMNVTITTGAPGDPTASGQLWSFTAEVAGGVEGTTPAAIESYSWDFGDGTSATTSGKTTAHVYETAATEQRRTVTVTVRTQDGRTATGRTEILVAM